MLDLVPLNPFGRLEAIKPVRVIGRGWVWLCRCKCGNTCEVKSTLLRRGSTKSCGCLRREHARRIARNHRKPVRVVVELLRHRKMGFTYKVLGQLFKLSPSRCHALVEGGDMTIGSKITLGEVYGSWTVIRRTSDRRRVRFTCRCTCGREADVLAQNLTGGTR